MNITQSDSQLNFSNTIESYRYSLVYNQLPNYLGETFNDILNLKDGSLHLSKQLPIDKLNFLTLYNKIYDDLCESILSEKDINFFLDETTEERFKIKQRWVINERVTVQRRLKKLGQEANYAASEYKEWEKDHTQSLCSFTKFKTRKTTSKIDCLILDIKYEILTILINANPTTIQKHTPLAANPFFSLQQAKMPLSKLDNQTEYISDYAVSNEYYIRTIISEEAFKGYTSLMPSKANINIKNLRYLDSLDCRILTYILSQLYIPNLLNDNRKVVISIKDLTKKLLNSNSMKAYEQIRTHLAKLGTYKICGIYKDSKENKDLPAFIFSFFSLSYINIEQKPDLTQAIITMDSDFIDFLINQATIEAPIALQSLSPKAEMIFFPLHYDRLNAIIKAAKDSIPDNLEDFTMTFNYSYFRSRIIFPLNDKGKPIRIKKNMEIVINAIEELKQAHLLIKAYVVINSLTIRITFLPASKHELQNLFVPFTEQKTPNFPLIQKK